MSRDRHSHHRNGGNWKNNQNEASGREQKNRDGRENRDSRHNAVSSEQIRAEEAAITAFKNSNQCVCPKCQKPIQDLSQAIADKTSGTPIHFDCALEILLAEEKLGPGDKLTYIGQGRFGVLNFPNVHDMKHFTIKKIIEWEEKDKRSSWRNEMSDLYSQVR